MAVLTSTGGAGTLVADACGLAGFELPPPDAAAVARLAPLQRLGLGYLFLALGARRGISPVASCIISNVEPVLNPIWVFLAVGENPGVYSIAGAAIVLLAVTLQSLYEMRRAARAKPEKQ